MDKYFSCAMKVDAGASMVRGFHNQRWCEGRVVFEHNGKGYCAVHGKPLGYVPPPKPPTKTYVVHFQALEGKSRWAFAYDVRSERGAKARIRHIFGQVVIQRIEEMPEGFTTDDAGNVVPFAKVRKWADAPIRDEEEGP